MQIRPSIVDVRRAGPEDAAVVLTMVREIAASEDDASDAAGTAESWAAMLARPDVVVLLAERDGVPVGYLCAVRMLHLWLGRDILALDDLFVRDGYRGARVGRLLMHALARLATAEDLLVRWEVDERNVDAQRFCLRLGATLHTEVIAAWTPEAQRAALRE